MNSRSPTRQRLKAWANALGPPAQAHPCNTCPAWTIRLSPSDTGTYRCSACREGRDPYPTQTFDHAEALTGRQPSPGMHEGQA